MKILGHLSPFQTLHSGTNIHALESRSFFDLFIKQMYAIRQQSIMFPSTKGQLNEITRCYEENYLPVEGQVMWSRAIVLSEITIYARGWRNILQSVLKSSLVMIIKSLLFHLSNFACAMISRLSWQMKLSNWSHSMVQKCEVATLWWIWNRQEDYGVWLICNGGYLHWPQLVCPYKHKVASSWKGYFSTGIKNVHKDIECVFGILKKRWKILD